MPRVHGGLVPNNSHQVEFEYIVATSDTDLYFLATNYRQDLKTDKEAMSHTCLQKIFSVLTCKQRMEKVSGPLSEQSAISVSIVLHR